MWNIMAIVYSSNLTYFTKQVIKIVVSGEILKWDHKKKRKRMKTQKKEIVK